jgi:hypothetical protein
LKATNLALLATGRDTGRAEALLDEMIGESRKLVVQHLSLVGTPFRATGKHESTL